MKRVAVVTAIVLLMGCSLIDTNPFVGKWEADDPFSPGVKVWWEFTDTTLTSSNSADAFVDVMTYTYTDTTIVVTYDDDTQDALSYTFTQSGDLVVTSGISIIFRPM